MVFQTDGKTIADIGLTGADKVVAFIDDIDTAKMAELAKWRS